MTMPARRMTTAAASPVSPVDLAGLIEDLRRATVDTPSQAGKALLQMAIALATLAALPGPTPSEPPDEPLCLRVRLPGGGSVAFSGDTAMCQGLLDAADGADILVAECSALAPPCGQHTSWEDWRRMLPRVRARRIVLTHLGHEVRAKQEELKKEAPPDIDLYFADDGMTFAL